MAVPFTNATAALLIISSCCLTTNQIIYAEGIAAGSLLIDPRTRAAVPDQVRTSGDSHGHRPHWDYEVQEKLLANPDAVDLWRKASST
jgi:hypothetical protein